MRKLALLEPALLQELRQPQRWQQQQRRKRPTLLHRWHLLLYSTLDTQRLQMSRGKNKAHQFSSLRTQRHSRALWDQPLHHRCPRDGLPI